MTDKQVVVFSIAMQNGDGIMSKSPSYIQEKLNACSAENDKGIESILDSNNLSIFNAYEKRWGRILNERKAKE